MCRDAKIKNECNYVADGESEMARVTTIYLKALHSPEAIVFNMNIIR